MAERMVPKPDLIGEEAAISGLNLSVLQRLDPLIEEILAVATHAFVYEIDAVTDSWREKNAEGSFFIVQRNATQKFQFIIMNRSNPEDLVEDILEIGEYDVRPPFLIYRNKDEVVRAILFYEDQACKDICNVLDRILSAYRRTSPKPKLSPSKSEPEKTAVDPTSDYVEGPSNFSAARSDLSTDNSLLDLILNRATTAVATSAVEQLNLHQELHRLSLATTQPIPSTEHPPLTSALLQNYLQNLMKPTDFAYRPPDSSIFAPSFSNSSSPSICFTPNIVSSVTVSSHYATSLLAPFPPPMNQSQVQNSTNAATTIKEKIREVLTGLVTDDSFVDMVYGEILGPHLQ